MDIFKSNAPAYKTATKLVTTHAAHAQPAPSGGLSGLLGSLFGNATPAYKNANGARPNAPVSSGIFGSFLSVGSPSYKTATAAAVPVDANAELAGDVDTEVIVIDRGVDEEACGCPPASDEIVVL